MSLLKGSQDNNSDINQRTQLSFYETPKSLIKPGTEQSKGDGLNNNQDEYKMDVKINGNEKVAEDDPLTGHRKWDETEGSKESRWTQRFASTNFFMVIFLLAYVLQGNQIRKSSFKRI